MTLCRGKERSKEAEKEKKKERKKLMPQPANLTAYPATYNTKTRPTNPLTPRGIDQLPTALENPLPPAEILPPGFSDAATVGAVSEEVLVKELEVVVLSLPPRVRKPLAGMKVPVSSVEVNLSLVLGNSGSEKLLVRIAGVLRTGELVSNREVVDVAGGGRYVAVERIFTGAGPELRRQETTFVMRSMTQSDPAAHLTGC
jgi:hypothetical protein